MMKITDLFNEDELTEKNDGNYQTTCPDCGLQGGRTEGFIIFTETNQSFCHSSGKHFNFLETYALKKKIIKCIDGKETGQKTNVLHGDLFKETLQSFREEYTSGEYNKMLSMMGIKESIQLPNDGVYISEFAKKIAKKVSPENIFFFRPDTTQIVEIGKIKHVDGETEYTGFVPVYANRFITIIEKYFKPWANVYTKQGTKIINKSMSASVANIVLCSDEFRDTMPIINRIFTIPIPIIHKGKLTFPKKGYDERFGSWLPYNAPDITDLNMSVENAKKIIEKIYCEFCYLGRQDYMNAIAGLITPFIRGLYERFTCRTPLFIITANRERAGKDYHEGVRSIVYEGMTLEEPPISNSDNAKSNQNDELRKKILSGMLYGKKKMHFSNNKGFINNAVFESILTAENFSDRKLGSNTILNFPHEIEYSLSGNVGIGMTPDLSNRSRKITLFLDVEDANSRNFQTPDLHGWVMKNREVVLSALYSLVRNWVDKGCPDGKIPFTSFPEWARVCGGIMESAGYDSPCKPDRESLGVSADSETSDMKQLFELCYERYPDTEISKKNIKDLIENDGDGLFGYFDWGNKADQTKFGIKLNKYVGRVLSDISLQVTNKEVRSVRWKYVFTKKKENLDKKSIFGDDFDEKVATYGYLGHLSNPDENPTKGIIEDSEQVSKVTKVAKPSKDSKLQKDRQVQFWESPECVDIKPNHSKQDILEYFNQTPKATPEQMYDKFGVGSMKFFNELLESGELIQKDGGYYGK